MGVGTEKVACSAMVEVALSPRAHQASGTPAEGRPATATQVARGAATNFPSAANLAARAAEAAAREARGELDPRRASSCRGFFFVKSLASQDLSVDISGWTLLPPKLRCLHAACNAQCGT